MLVPITVCIGAVLVLVIDVPDIFDLPKCDYDYPSIGSG
jgi:hypothetical protein